jgi:hypothetical protein
MDEHEGRQLALDAGRAHDLELDLLAVHVDHLVRHIRRRQRHGHTLLGAFEHATGSGWRQLLERLAGTGFQGIEEFLGAAFDAGAAGGGSDAGGDGQGGGEKGFAQGDHGGLPFLLVVIRLAARGRQYSSSGRSGFIA